MRVLLIGAGVTSGLIALIGGIVGTVILADTAFGGVEGQKKLNAFVDRHRTFFRLIGLLDLGETASSAR